jgi:hypothetical protein
MNPHVATEDKFGFPYHYQSTHFYAKSCVEMPPRAKTSIATKRALVTILFTGMKLLLLGVLPRKQKFNQDHFLAMIAPEIQ